MYSGPCITVSPCFSLPPVFADNKRNDFNNGRVRLVIDQTDWREQAATLTWLLAIGQADLMKQVGGLLTLFCLQIGTIDG